MSDRSISFYWVDVFASRPLTGNPLALVPDADDLDESQMHAIAREFNQSETTFLLRPRLPGATCRLRSFHSRRRRGGRRRPQRPGRVAVAGRLRSPPRPKHSLPRGLALLVAAGKAPDGVAAVVEQGRALGRPSRIQVTVTGQRVRVSGSGLVVAEGTLRL